MICKLVFSFTNVTERIHHILRWLFRNLPGYVTCLHCPKVNEKGTIGSFHISTVWPASLAPLMRNEYSCTLANKQKFALVIKQQRSQFGDSPRS